MTDGSGGSELVAPPGLKGLVVADTAIGSVRGAEGFYHYRCHDAVEIARERTFEAATALLIDGSLPSASEEAVLGAELGRGRQLDPSLSAALDLISPLAASPMAGLRVALSLLGGDTPTIDQTPAERREQALRAVAAVPTVLAGLYRRSRGLEPVAPRPELGVAADYLNMVTGNTATGNTATGNTATGNTVTPAAVRAVETYLVLTADHGFNASTFTARVVTSTGASVGAALVAAVGALSGPLHGGAPSRVLDMVEAIGEPSRAESWARGELEAGRPLMGFGHAVYRAEDPRSVLLREVAQDLGGELVERAIEIEARILALLREWKPSATIVTNVEYYAAVVLHLAGLPQEMFAPTFTTSRVVGWAAHVLEQAADNKIMRPSSRYVGPPVRPLGADGAGQPVGSGGGANSPGRASSHPRL